MEPHMVDRTGGGYVARSKGAGAKPPTGKTRGASKSGASKTPAKRAASKGAGSKSQEPTRGRARGLEPASSFLRGSLADAAAKRGIAETKLITRWEEIVGPDLASASQPLQLKRRAGLALGGVLILAVDGARATEIEYKLPQLTERINAYYGYRAVAEVKLTQAVEGLKKSEAHRRAERPKPTAAQKKRVETMVSAIEDGGLRSALARLGENVMARAAEKKTSAPHNRGSARGGKRSSLAGAAAPLKSSTDQGGDA